MRKIVGSYHLVALQAEVFSDVEPMALSVVGAFMSMSLAVVGVVDKGEVKFRCIWTCLRNYTKALAVS